MNLCKRFTEASSGRPVNISSLEKENSYSLEGAERLQNKYGISILLTIKASSEYLVRVFLPRLFINVFSDTDIDMINGGMIKIGLILSWHVGNK